MTMTREEFKQKLQSCSKDELIHQLTDLYFTVKFGHRATPEQVAGDFKKIKPS